MLHVPGGAFDFASIQTNLPGQPLGTGGTVITPVIGSKGNWAEVFSALDSDTFGLLICVHNGRTSAANRQTVIDIGIGAAGSEQVVIPNLIGSNAGLFNSIGGLWYYFPIYLPAGTRVAARAQSSAVTTVRLMARAFQLPRDPSMVKTLGYVEAIGVSGITPTTCNPGTTSESSWVLLGTTSRDLWWWQMGIQSTNTAMSTAFSHFDLAVGDGTNFSPILTDVGFVTSTDEQSGKPLFLLGCERFIPGGSSLYARGQCDVSFSPFQVCAYGGA